VERDVLLLNYKELDSVKHALVNDCNSFSGIIVGKIKDLSFLTILRTISGILP